MMQCSLNFESKYAFLNGKQITISEYLEGNTERGTLRCIPNNHELISVNPMVRRPHFRHKHNSDMDTHPMTAWHAEWQSNFPVVEVPFCQKVRQLRDRRADVVLHDFKRIIEIQHSEIKSGDVNERMSDYALHGYTVSWIIHGNSKINVKMLGQRRVLELKPTDWRYVSFLNCDYVYYDVDGFIYRVDPNLIKSGQVDVNEPKLKDEFIESLKTNTNIWEANEPKQCYLYFKQQGAGSGKTYGMMQMLNSHPEITHYKYIALVTKQHSAVKVMLKEFDEQTDNGNLTNIQDVEKYTSKSGNQYIRMYINNLTNIQCTAIFGTVDSFTNALGQAPLSASDKFLGIVKSIKDGTIRTNYNGKMIYANINPVLNKEMLIMIDETQDLTEVYGDAFLQIVNAKSANLCVVGDRLQSLSYEDNTLTRLHLAEVAQMEIIKSDVSNVVRRFTDPTLIKFVNDLIPFESFDLPPMTPYKLTEKMPDALTVFKGKAVYANQSEESENVVKAVEQLMELFKKEVETCNRVPEDFLIVTPFTKKNPLVEAFQIAIDTYWKDLMESNITYIENVKSKHEYWKDIDVSQYRRYAIFHKSEDGCSINTNESINATRIVSIHSSKGDGRKVVFVIGVTQAALQLFSHNNLIYTSLLHVSITRQKEKLYFLLESNNDDIHNRIIKSDTNIVVDNTTFDILSKKVKVSRIASIIEGSAYDELYSKIISKNESPALPPKSTNEHLIIDMGDHNIMYSSIIINIIVHCCNNSKTQSELKKQFVAILYSVKDAIIDKVDKWQDYIHVLQNNNKKNGDTKEKKHIPILDLASIKKNQAYERYFNIIKSTIDRIRTELNNIPSLEYFCPFESIVLYYIIESSRNGVYQSITISDLYNIIDIYSKVYDSSAYGHSKCKCNILFQNNNLKLTKSQEDYKKYLYHHYERLTHLNNLLDDFNIKYPDVNWLYSHHILLNNKQSFSISKKKDMIGYNKNTVFNIYIKPQLNELNFNEFLLESILDTYILCNLEKDSENYKRFGNKPVISYVLALNREKMYQVNWTTLVNENKSFIKELLFDKMYEMFSSRHIQYHSTFLNRVNENKDISFTQVIEKCDKDMTADDKPIYLHDIWNYISKQLDDCDEDSEKELVILKYKKKEEFIKLFDKSLKKSLKAFLDIKD